MEQSGWADRVAATVGERVAHYRKLDGLTAQALADRCDKLGHKIHRSLIAKLEGGYRTVTLADLLILARALHVPPVLLLIPLGERERVELLPGVETGAWQAVKWFGGRQHLLPDHLLRPMPLPKGPPPLPVSLFEMQERDIDRWNEEGHAAAVWREKAAEDTNEELRAVTLAAAEMAEAHMQRLAEGIRDARRRLRADGFDPGPLPDYVRIIDSDAADDGE